MQLLKHCTGAAKCKGCHLIPAHPRQSTRGIEYIWHGSKPSPRPGLIYGISTPGPPTDQGGGDSVPGEGSTHLVRTASVSQVFVYSNETWRTDQLHSAHVQRPRMASNTVILLSPHPYADP